MSTFPCIRPALVLFALLVLVTSDICAHDAAGSTEFDLLIPGDAWSGQITFVTLIGPASGEEVLHATWNLTFFSPPGGTPASEVVLELGLPVPGTTDWVLHGSDLGWPAANGTFQATLDSDQLNGVLQGGLFPFTTADLAIGAVNGGLTGQFIDSTITLELAGEPCQTDLGFAGPGTMSLQICGDPLATGGTASLDVTGAPPSSTVLLAVSLGNLPTPFYGGTLVPVPVQLVVVLSADAGGAARVPVPGGGGPATVYVQAAAADGGLPFGWAVSNALEVELLP